MVVPISSGRSEAADNAQIGDERAASNRLAIKKQQMIALGSAGIGFTPHIIIVKAEEHATAKILAAWTMADEGRRSRSSSNHGRSEQLPSGGRLQSSKSMEEPTGHANPKPPIARHGPSVPRSSASTQSLQPLSNPTSKTQVHRLPARPRFDELAAPSGR
ncbi:hypothetical protein ACLOJK_004848 [Asimina triloba]